MASDAVRSTGTPARHSYDIERAFVVHLDAPNGSLRRRYAGHVEHLASGDSAPFASLRELLSFFALVDRVLGAAAKSVPVPVPTKHHQRPR